MCVYTYKNAFFSEEKNQTAVVKVRGFSRTVKIYCLHVSRYQSNRSAFVKTVVRIDKRPTDNKSNRIKVLDRVGYKTLRKTFRRPDIPLEHILMTTITNVSLVSGHSF